MVIPKDPSPEKRTGNLPDDVLAWISRWKELDEEIKSWTDTPHPYPAGGTNPLVAKKNHRRQLRNKIMDYLEDHPGKVNAAVSAGFSYAGVGEADDGTRDDKETTDEAPGDKPDADSDKDADSQKYDQNRDRTRTSNGGVDITVLPGQRGKDYRVVRYNGKTFVVYHTKVGGHTIQMSWRVPEDKLEAYGLSKGDGAPITRAQFKKLEHFGPITDVRLRDKTHPFHSWLESVEAQYGGTGILKNKEVMSVLLMGYMEGWSAADIQGKIRQTKWWDNTTTYRRDWVSLGKKDKDTTIKSFRTKMVEQLENIYGDDWRSHVDEKNLDKWATRISSGAYGARGNPNDAFDLWAMRHTNKAEKITGTPAQIAKAQEKEEALKADPRYRAENEFERLRGLAVRWLGYQGRPSNEVLKGWAGEIIAGTKTDADFSQWLRKTKETLYPYLDPDEPWMDRADIFKRMAEEWLGRTISYDDRLLRDFTKKKEDGSPVGDGRVAMSSWDFERVVRSDKRFDTSKTAHQEGYGFLNLIDGMFNGQSVGGF